MQFQDLAFRLPKLGRLLRERTILYAERQRLWELLATSQEGLAAELQRTTEALRISNAELSLAQESIASGAEILSHPGVQWAPPGHFYSPIPDRETLALEAQASGLGGVALPDSEMLALAKTIFSPTNQFAAPLEKQSGQRYYFNNPAYSFADAIFYAGVLQHLRPKRVIEVGSGFSSALLLDVVESVLQNSIDITFIEPYPELLHALISAADRNSVRIVNRPVQDLDPEIFQDLKANDILFIDSTHVSRFRSDVNFLFLEVLPRLQPGVWVHIHDVFDGFEYPTTWRQEGRCWNEQYLLQALLQNNNRYAVRLMNSRMTRLHRPWFEKNVPLALCNTGGSIWLERLAPPA